MKRNILALTLAVLGLFTAGASAQFINYTSTLGGNTSDITFGNFTEENRPSGVSTSVAGTAGQWTSGIASGSLLFSGVTGFESDTTDFLASGSGGGIYSFSSNTHYQIASTSVLPNLETLIFQLSIAEGTPGSALFAGPTLTVFAGLSSQNLSANYQALTAQTSVVIFGMPSKLDSLAYQWDLSGIADPITGFSIAWQTDQHDIVYGMDVTQGDRFVQAVPEPSTWMLLGLGFAVVLWKSNRRLRSLPTFLKG
ncbi:MAG: PEP-CTERM sorting domain-containing protein [Chthoniobacterales bacterium]